MSAVVLDFEGFHLQPHGFIVKEIAFCNVTNGDHGCWTFKPPHSWDLLPANEERSFSWAIRNLHGLSWDSGKLPYCALRPILMSISVCYTHVYIKGLQKAKFLETLLGRPICNLEDLECPKIQHLPVPTVSCDVHASGFYHCALVKACAFAVYIKERTPINFIHLFPECRMLNNSES